MDVVLTIDVESYTGDYEAEVFAAGLGLPFILDCCARHGVRATFFVEALGATRWGPAGLRRICDALAAAGQDVQLHVHPIVARLDGFVDREDVLWKWDASVQTRLLEEGLRQLRACAAGNVFAFRAGDFAADEATLEAMRRAGLPWGSNRDLDQKTSIRTKLNRSFPVFNDLGGKDGIVDMPVTALRSPFSMLDGPYRHMEIAAMGTREMCDGLAKAQRAGYAAACILTHPGEFFRRRGGAFRAWTKNCRRLDAVLAFASAHPDLRVTALDDLRARARIPSVSPPELRAHPLYSLMRIVSQGIDRLRR